MPENDPTPLSELLARHGSARNPDSHPKPRPEGLSDDAVEALGQLSAALETAEDARGHLYAFHRLSGRADLDLQEAVHSLRDAGLKDVAEAVDQVLVGRNVVRDMWTFQIVESYDEQYISVFRDVERSARASVGDAAAHIFESELKTKEQHEGAS